MMQCEESSEHETEKGSVKGDKEGDKEGDKQGENREENGNSMHEDRDVSNRHMTWWKRGWWIRIDDGSSMRSAKGRRRVWRAPRRAAEQARDGDLVDETRQTSEEVGKKWRTNAGERQKRQ